MAVQWGDKIDNSWRIRVRGGVNDGLVYTCNRALYSFSKTEWVRRLQQVGLRRALQPNDPLLIVTSDYGYLLQIAMDNGAQQAWATDPTPLIHTRRLADSGLGDNMLYYSSQAVIDRMLAIDIADVDVVQQMVAAGAGYTSGPQARRGKFVVVVTDMYLNRMGDTVEAGLVITGCNALTSGISNSAVIHLVNARDETVTADEDIDGGVDRTVLNGDPDLLYLNPAEWSALAPTHWWFFINKRTPTGDMLVWHNGGPV